MAPQTINSPLSMFARAACALLLAGSGSVLAQSGSGPQVTIKNGTVEGKHVASLDQDLFLGIPFAQPPVGDLRFQNPQSINTSWPEIKNATEYGPSCVGYGNSPAWPFTLSEDCLTINIVRPSGFNDSKLPIGTFIHGGGWTMDYAANGVYNLSFIVQESVAMGKPIMAVSFDYRLSLWGFMASEDMLSAGVANLGLKDQRLALHWIQENIASFGGDPDRVVIWGESAGGGNVGYQATAFGGRDDGLFRGLVSQSGAEGSRPADLTAPNQKYENITRAAGCGNAEDRLACLRRVPFAELNATVASLTSMSFYPVVDEDLVPGRTSELLAAGNFTRVPFLLGTNSDEGTSFTAAPVDTDGQVRAQLLAGGVDAETATILMALYPDVDALGLPEGYRTRANDSVGLQYKRAVALSTDQGFLSFRRLRTDAWSKFGVPAYSYLFDSPLSDEVPQMGTSHFTEIGYVFYNVDGLGYAPGVSPLEGASQDKLDLAQLTTRMWISFISDLDPNGHGLPDVEAWPTYNATGGYGENFFLHPNGSRVISDTFRLAGTTFINSVAREQYDR